LSATFCPGGYPMSNDPTTNAPPSSHPVPSVTPAAAKAAPPASTTSSFLAYLFLGTSRPGEIVVYRHSNLFYWWPVWAFGFIMAIITFFDDKHMAIVPAGTAATKAIQGEALVNGNKVDLKDRDILVIK